MKIDYTKPLIDIGPTINCPIRYLRYCDNCGQRYAIYSADNQSFVTYMTMFRNLIQCPACGLYGTSTPHTEDKQFAKN